MTDKVTDLQKARKCKRQKTGWTTEEIKKRAAEERAAYKGLAENEPDALASGGDMSNIWEEPDDDEEAEPTTTGS